MGKLYHTNEVGDFLDKKLVDMITEAVNDRELTGEALSGMIEHIRLLQDFADEIIADMEKADEEYEAEMAAWRAKQEAKQDGTDS